MPKVTTIDVEVRVDDDIKHIEEYVREHVLKIVKWELEQTGSVRPLAFIFCEQGLMLLDMQPHPPTLWNEPEVRARSADFLRGMCYDLNAKAVLTVFDSYIRSPTEELVQQHLGMSLEQFSAAAEKDPDLYDKLRDVIPAKEALQIMLETPHDVKHFCLMYERVKHKRYRNRKQIKWAEEETPSFTQSWGRFTNLLPPSAPDKN